MILEKKKEELENEMLNPDNLDDYNILREIESEYSSLQEKLSLLYQKWELIVEG